MKELLRILKKDRVFVIFTLAAGILNSTLFSLLLVIINNHMQGRQPFLGSFRDEGLLFFSLMGISYTCRKIFQYRMIKLTNQMLFDFESAMIGGIKDSEFESFSRLDHSLVYTAIADIRTIAQLPRYFADMVNYIMVILICLVYLFILSSLCGIVVLLCGAAMILFYRRNNRRAVGLLRRSRELENHFYDYVRDLLEGFRYVKLNPDRAQGLFADHITANRSATREAEIGASLAYTRNELLGSYGWLIILGMPVFILPLFFPALRGLAASVTIAILYIMAPVGSLLSALPFLARIRVSTDRIGSLRRDLEPPSRLAAAKSPAATAPSPAAKSPAPHSPHPPPTRLLNRFVSMK